VYLVWEVDEIGTVSTYAVLDERRHLLEIDILK